MLNSTLSHHFKTFGGLIGGVWQSAVALRSCFSSANLQPEYEVQIQGIDRNLEVLLRTFQQMADEYREGIAPIDLELANLTYVRGVHEWRKNLEQLLETADQIMRGFPVTDSQEAREILVLLRRLQHDQRQVMTLKELLEKYGE